MIGVIGFLLGLLFFVVGVFPLVSKFGFASSIPSQVSQILTSWPAVATQIGFIVGGIFLWIDATRRTRVFNGLISIIVGLVCIFVGAYPFLVSQGIIPDLVGIPYTYYTYLLIVLGILLMYDSFGAKSEKP